MEHTCVTITFEVGTNADLAQVQVQNRVAIAIPAVAIRGSASGRRDQETIRTAILMFMNFEFA